MGTIHSWKRGFHSSTEKHCATQCRNKIRFENHGYVCVWMYTELLWWSIDPPALFPLVHSFVGLVKYVFTVPDVSFLSNMPRFTGEPFWSAKATRQSQWKSYCKGIYDNHPSPPRHPKLCRTVCGNCCRSNVIIDQGGSENTPLPKHSRQGSSS